MGIVIFITALIAYCIVAGIFLYCIDRHSCGFHTNEDVLISLMWPLSLPVLILIASTVSIAGAIETLADRIELCLTKKENK